MLHSHIGVTPEDSLHVGNSSLPAWQRLASTAECPSHQARQLAGHLSEIVAFFLPEIVSWHVHVAVPVHCRRAPLAVNGHRVWLVWLVCSTRPPLPVFSRCCDHFLCLLKCLESQVPSAGTRRMRYLCACCVGCCCEVHDEHVMSLQMHFYLTSALMLCAMPWPGLCVKMVAPLLAGCWRALADATPPRVE